MSKKKKKSINEEIDDHIFDYCHAASASDCTGLIGFGPTTDAQIEAYEELYPFLPPQPPKE